MFLHRLSLSSNTKFWYAINFLMINVKSNTSKPFDIKHLDESLLFTEKLKDISLEEYIMILFYLQVNTKDLPNFTIMKQLWYQYQSDKIQQGLATQCLQQNNSFSVNSQDKLNIITDIILQPIVISLQELTYIEQTLLPLIKHKLQENKKKTEIEGTVTLLISNPDGSISSFNAIRCSTS